MANWTLLDHIFNVCRTVSDVLHILSYLLLVTVAIIFAIYRTDRGVYDRHIYLPTLQFLAKFNIFKVVKSTRHISRRKYIVYTVTWGSTSNRLPYIIKTIKNWFNQFK